MSSSTNRTRTLTTLGILTAIILVMTFTPLGYIKTMGLEITLLHIPVILGAALTGPAGGMVLGAVFGFTSFFQCFGLSTFGTTLFSINPAGTFIVCAALLTSTSGTPISCIACAATCLMASASRTSKT